MKTKHVFKHNKVDVEIIIISADSLSAWRKLSYIVGYDKIFDYELISI